MTFFHQTYESSVAQSRGRDQGSILNFNFVSFDDRTAVFHLCGDVQPGIADPIVIGAHTMRAGPEEKLPGCTYSFIWPDNSLCALVLAAPIIGEKVANRFGIV